RQRPSDLANIFVRSATTGQLVPLASVISLEEGSSTLWLRRTDGTPSITLSGPLAEGVSIAEGIEEARDLVREVLPPEAQLSFDGKARAFLDENRSILITFALAVLIVFLVLAGQFESFVHPLIIMLTVPLAVTGGLLGLTAFGVGLNVFSQIGMILLVGLMAKNGILMVEFANQLRASGASVRSAIRQAAEIRLRPIVMTTLSTMLGAVPLVLSGGAGSEGRAALAIVVLAGVGFATVLTLYVIPVLYNCLARFSKPANAVTERLARLELEHPAAGE
ncbi:MAG: efflux RND transporter permease subunit, partial [Alphaproteobacteria bacterium]